MIGIHHLHTVSRDSIKKSIAVVHYIAVKYKQHYILHTIYVRVCTAIVNDSTSLRQ